MLISCPECERRVSDRAKSCPDCGFPVAEEVAAERARGAAERAVQTREATDQQADCPTCDARGFITDEGGAFAWCRYCEHSGRVVLCRASDGFYAVALTHVEDFCAGDLHRGGPEVSFLGPDAPKDFKYPEPGDRVSAEDAADLEEINAAAVAAAAERGDPGPEPGS